MALFARGTNRTRHRKTQSLPSRKRLTDGSQLGYKNWMVSTTFDLEKWAQKRGYDENGLDYLEAKGVLKKIVIAGKKGANVQWYDPKSRWKRSQSVRTGVLGTKMGMRMEMDWWGDLHPVTLVHVPHNFVAQTKTKDTDGYTAVQVGAGLGKLKRLNKSMMGHFAKANIPPAQKILEFRVTEDAVVRPGTRLLAQHFVPGQLLDVKGITKGKGFQGVMKRHGFAGGPASHGSSLFHRGLGSTGQRQDPGRVFKGKKMPGHMGSKSCVVRNLRLMKMDVHNQIIWVKGSIPGAKGSWVQLRDAAFKPPAHAPPFPTFFTKPHLSQPKFLYYRFKDPYRDVREIDWETKAAEMMASLRAAQIAGEAEEEAAASAATQAGGAEAAVLADSL